MIEVLVVEGVDEDEDKVRIISPAPRRKFPGVPRKGDLLHIYDGADSRLVRVVDVIWRQSVKMDGGSITIVVEPEKEKT